LRRVIASTGKGGETWTGKVAETTTGRRAARIAAASGK
jgi:hypothetical protein